MTNLWPTKRYVWLRRLDSHQRSSAYETDEDGFSSTPRLFKNCWWAWRITIPRPENYEFSALPLSYTPIIVATNSVVGIEGFEPSPHAPKACTLPGYAIPRRNLYYTPICSRLSTLMLFTSKCLANNSASTSTCSNNHFSRNVNNVSDTIPSFSKLSTALLTTSMKLS